ncbi:MAG TPA: NAD(P)/FAD-dependent oxidoreductase [Mycobacteriales bacterium]|jgi:cation diffusion facilitator CzcD-associated flavoprotein CzcO|nr:NAD(P)/FAD-dependent oxidoreductase [Mycobacteriales bacterium]
MTEAEVDVLIVGAGITGIYQLYRAREAGFSALLLEAGDGVGGTWFWNRYPGARFDSESYTYGYLFSEELFNDWEWSEHFAGQPEIERYLNHVVDRFDLRRDIRLGAHVTAATYDETAATWTVTTNDGTTTSARFLIAATGVLSVPFFPDVPGREDFGGVQLHTGLWPAEAVDLTGKRVAIIGTGSSGVQLVPAVLDEVASLTVYQRTPNWCTPLNNSPITAEEQTQLRADFAAIKHTLDTSLAGFLHPPGDRKSSDDSLDDRLAFYEQMWAKPGFGKIVSHYLDLTFDEAANDAWCEFMAAKIRGLVASPAVADQLIPKDHRFGEKRPPFVTDYFEAFNDPKVSLVSLEATPILRVMPTGIDTVDGFQELDVIVWATGFDFGTGALSRIGIVGADGVALTDHWADGPSTYLGLQTAGFPNFFFPGGPHAAAGNNPRYNGDQVDFITELLIAARDRAATTIEVTTETEDRWTAMIDRAASRPPSFTEKSYYFGTNVPGKPRKYLLNAAGRPKLLSLIAESKAHDYEPFVFDDQIGRPGSS